MNTVLIVVLLLVLVFTGSVLSFFQNILSHMAGAEITAKLFLRSSNLNMVQVLLYTHTHICSNAFR